MQRATIGGVLGMVASIIGILGSLMFMALPALMRASNEMTGEYEDAVLALASGFYIILGVLGLIMSAVGIVGSVFALRRRVFGLALTGAIFSSIVFYPLGIVAVILVSMGYQEFRRPAPLMAAPPAPPSQPVI